MQKEKVTYLKITFSKITKQKAFVQKILSHSCSDSQVDKPMNHINGKRQQEFSESRKQN